MSYLVILNGKNFYEAACLGEAIENCPKGASILLINSNGDAIGINPTVDNGYITFDKIES